LFLDPELPERLEIIFNLKCFFIIKTFVHKVRSKNDTVTNRLEVPCWCPSMYGSCSTPQNSVSNLGSAHLVFLSQSLCPSRTWIGLTSCCNLFSTLVPTISSFVPARRCPVLPDSSCFGTFGTCSCDKVVGRGEERRGPQAMVKTRNRFALGLFFSFQPLLLLPLCRRASWTGNL